MKKILFYPQKTLNEYTSIMRDCIDKEKYILCKNKKHPINIKRMPNLIYAISITLRRQRQAAMASFRQCS